MAQKNILKRLSGLNTFDYDRHLPYCLEVAPYRVHQSKAGAVVCRNDKMSFNYAQLWEKLAVQHRGKSLSILVVCLVYLTLKSGTMYFKVRNNISEAWQCYKRNTATCLNANPWYKMRFYRFIHKVAHEV